MNEVNTYADIYIPQIMQFPQSHCWIMVRLIYDAWDVCNNGLNFTLK